MCMLLIESANFNKKKAMININSSFKSGDQSTNFFLLDASRVKNVRNRSTFTCNDCKPINVASV